MIVPVKNILNYMGIELMHSGDTYTAVRDDDVSMTLTVGNEVMTVNGVEYSLTTAPYLYEDAVLMAPVKALENAFGVQSGVSSVTNNFYFTHSYEKPKTSIFSSWTHGKISASGEYDIAYTLNFPETAEVEVKYKKSTNHANEEDALYWHTAPNPIYIDGTWHGAFSVDIANVNYAFRAIVTNNGEKKIYESTYAAKTSKEAIISEYDTYVDVNDGLTLRSTYESISYYYKGIADDIAVYFRETGETEWEKVYTPYKDSYVDGMFRGSIVKLTPDTEYEIKIVVLDVDGNETGETLSGQIKTWTETPQIARTINLSDIYSGNGGLVLNGISGTENGWIKITDDGSTPVIANNNTDDGILIVNCKYVILEGITVSGGERNGIKIGGGCDNIRVIGCDISGWGRKGVLDKNAGVYKIDNDIPNNDAGVRIIMTGSVTVEKCYIHDPRGTANYWDGETWVKVHPNGPSGIFYGYSEPAVIRYNDIVGNDEHLFNDGIESWGNGSFGGGANRDSDIYGNYIANGADDVTEIDGSQMNVRYYRNRGENFLCGISTTANVAGPSYIFENLLTDLHMHYNRGQGGGGVKAGGGIIVDDRAYAGNIYLFNNTIDTDGYGVRCIGYGGVSELYAVTRNNILSSRLGNAAFLSSANEASMRDDIDYDLFNGKVNNVSGKTGENIILGAPTYIDADVGNYMLSDDSNGKGQAVAVENFIQSPSDIGTFGCADIKFMPYRPIKAEADKYRVDLTGKSYEIVNIIFDENIDTIGLYLDKTGSFFEANMDINGNLVTVEIISKESGDGNSEGFGAVMLRNSDGYSIPIWVGMNIE